jgi:hypothetical protein
VKSAQLALATILQAYTGVSDDELIECTLRDRRWPLVLDCLDAPAPPFSKPTLIAFRQRLIAAQADRRLLERAALTNAVGSRQVRAARDRSPLWVAGRVEDTYNTPANIPEASVTDALSLDLAAQAAELSELHIDRASLSSRWVSERDRPLTI